LILAAALLFSFSRSSLLNLGVALCVLLLVERRHIPVARWLGICIAGVTGGLVIVWVLAPTLGEAYLMRLWSTVTELAGEPDHWMSGRVENWSLLLQFLADHPSKLVFGIGYATLPHTELLGRPVIGDNMYLTLLVETGLIGLSALIALQVALLATAYRVSRSIDREAAFVGTWIFCFWIGQLVQMLSVDVITFWRVLPLYLGLLGMAVHRANLAAGQRHSR
jgi:O-antigen ligase